MVRNKQYSTRRELLSFLANEIKYDVGERVIFKEINTEILNDGHLIKEIESNRKIMYITNIFPTITNTISNEIEICYNLKTKHNVFYLYHVNQNYVDKFDPSEFEDYVDAEFKQEHKYISNFEQLYSSFKVRRSLEKNKV